MKQELVSNHNYMEYHGIHECIEFVVLLNSGGWRTAYVNVKGTFFEHLDYMECDNYIDVHGGFTYKDDRLPFEHEPNDYFTWLGWDYAHCCDGYDLQAVKKYFGESEYTKMKEYSLNLFHNNAHVYTLDEVISDCINVVEHIKKGV